MNAYQRSERAAREYHNRFMRETTTRCVMCDRATCLADAVDAFSDPHLMVCQGCARQLDEIEREPQGRLF